MRVLRAISKILWHVYAWAALAIAVLLTLDALEYHQAVIAMMVNQAKWLRAIANSIHGFSV
jgi:hypothetical protein